MPLIYNHYQLNITDDKIPELINDDLTLSSNDDGIRKTTFEINSTYNNKPKLTSLGKIAKDLSYDWIQESEKYINLEKVEKFLKSYQNNVLLTQAEQETITIFTPEQNEVLNIVDK